MVNNKSKEDENHRLYYAARITKKEEFRNAQAKIHTHQILYVCSQSKHQDYKLEVSLKKRKNEAKKASDFDLYIQLKLVGCL
ncbi:hypothetical protein SESBI_39134 [Sesbania bispinosa]|nr:hypothetical protein SESBI_39134 [Sesbania bispinosa]